MPKITLAFAAALILLGGIAFASTGAKTSLIPAYVGAALGIAGVIAFVGPTARKHAMHVAAMIGTLGALASLGRLVPALVRGTLPAPMATVSLVLMFLLCAGFVVVCVRSFVAARKARQAGAL